MTNSEQFKIFVIVFNAKWDCIHFIGIDFSGEVGIDWHRSRRNHRLWFVVSKLDFSIKIYTFPKYRVLLRCILRLGLFTHNKFVVWPSGPSCSLWWMLFCDPNNIYYVIRIIMVFLWFGLRNFKLFLWMRADCNSLHCILVFSTCNTVSLVLFEVLLFCEWYP